MAEIDQLIICNPYDVPQEHWRYNPETGEYDRVPGRRSAGYVKATEASRTGDDPGEFYPIELVNNIRKRVDRWRDGGYAGITGVTRELLEHWKDGTKRNDPLFFCQLEAMETMIWLTEAPASEKIGIDIPDDGSAFRRLCLKMATGSGKTVVMAMLMAWQTLNKVSNPNNGDYSKYFLIVAPGITVKSRLQVLWPPQREGSYYLKYALVPDSMYEDLKQARVIIHNWHTLVPLDDEPHHVVKKGPESDSAFARRILEHNYDNIMVINDEAHHAWRKTASIDNTKLKGEQKESAEMATLWVNGLDRIHRARRINTCYDFTATPFMPTGRRADEEALYKWVISDFSLNDAIESGLVKTPRMPAGDDGKQLAKSDKSKYYHLFEHETVKPDLNGRNKEDKVLPDLVRTGYMLLAKDWERTRNDLKGSRIPPVMITVCNSTDTSARIMHFFKNDVFDFKELADDDSIRRIDTKVLKAETGEKQDKESEDLREIINTVGQIGKPGEQIKNIIAVRMLSEGWDAKNVTQIMGLRAFTSQLLCEQVVGRGLRRSSYEIDQKTGLFGEEYVNIIGVPFSFLPHESKSVTRSEKSKTRVAPDPANAMHEITWPNVSRIETMVNPVLKITWSKVKTLEISARSIDASIHVAPMLENRPDLSRATELTLRDACSNIRMQTIIFYTVHDIFQMVVKSDGHGDRALLFAQLEKITEEFIKSGKIKVIGMPDDLEIRKNLAVMYNMQSVINHIYASIQKENISSKKLIFGFGGQTRSTSGVQPWYTTKKVLNAKKSHINPSPYDNEWEKKAAKEFERESRVASWVKNDRLGFVIKYQHEGRIQDYYPDYLVRLGDGSGDNDVMLVLEIKGQRTSQSDSKHEYMREWIETVNSDGRFGMWAFDVAYSPDEVAPIIKQHSPI